MWTAALGVTYVPTMLDIDAFSNLVPKEQGLSVVVTLRSDHTPQASVVNAGVMTHPITNQRVVAFVASGRKKVVNLRADPTVTVVIRAGWQWTAVEGTAELIGPDDPHPDLDAEHVRLLLREIFTAAGGTHDDWDAYDQVMREERRTAVLVEPSRIYSNPA